VKKEREEARAEETIKAELLRRRGLSDAQRAAEDEEFAKMRAGYGVDKEKWGFLQRYYHKGAFFQVAHYTQYTNRNRINMYVCISLSIYLSINLQVVGKRLSAARPTTRARSSR